MFPKSRRSFTLVQDEGVGVEGEHAFQSYIVMHMRLYIQGGGLKLLVPVLEPEQNIGWLKSDFKARALRRGKG